MLEQFRSKDNVNWEVANVMSYPSSRVTLGRVCSEWAFPLETDKLNSAKPSRQGCGHQIMAAWSLISMEGCTQHYSDWVTALGH